MFLIAAPVYRYSQINHLKFFLVIYIISSKIIFSYFSLLFKEAVILSPFFLPRLQEFLPATRQTIFLKWLPFSYFFPPVWTFVIFVLCHSHPPIAPFVSDLLCRYLLLFQCVNFFCFIFQSFDCRQMIEPKRRKLETFVDCTQRLIMNYWVKQCTKVKYFFLSFTLHIYYLCVDAASVVS